MPSIFKDKTIELLHIGGHGQDLRFALGLVKITSLDFEWSYHKIGRTHARTRYNTCINAKQRRCNMELNAMTVITKEGEDPIMNTDGEWVVGPVGRPGKRVWLCQRP